MTDYVGAWDCRYCDTKKIWGYNRACPNCGRPRAADTRFYHPADAPVISEEMKKYFDGGADWYCEHCDTGNKGDTDKCENCGAPRGKSQQHKVRNYLDCAPQSDEEAKEREVNSTVIPQSEYIAPDDVYSPPITDAASMLTKPEPMVESADHLVFDQKWLKRGLISLGIITVVIFSYLFFFKTHEVRATVSDFVWSQTVHIEEYQTFHEEGWSIPYGGRVTNQEIRLSGYVTITDGYTTESYPDTCYRSEYRSRTCETDNGNGSFSTYECGSSESVAYSCTNTRSVPITHQEPVFNTWYYYDIDRWVTISNHPTSGNDHKPYYDEATPKGDLQRRVEIPGTYTVNFRCADPGNFSRNYDITEWRKMDYGQEVKVTVNFFKAILKIE
jgi:hypothetical protein